MTRIRTFLALLVAPLLLLTACSDTRGSVPAASINGTELSDVDFRATLELLAGNPEFATQIFPTPPRADGSEGTDRVDSAFAAAVLELEVLVELLDQEFERRDLSITEADRTAVRDAVPAELTTALEELPEDYADWFVDWNAKVKAIQASVAEEPTDEITDEEVRATYDENLAMFEEQVCASHVLVETEAEAQVVLDELEAGGDLAAIATERSTDPSAAQNGGDLGCTSPTSYVEPFAEAVTNGEVGELLGPVQTEFGFHVIRVASRGVTFEDASEQIRSQLELERSDPQAAFNALLASIVADADIVISSRYGTWDAEAGTVTPPEAPEGEPGTVTIG
ncbi:MAG: peptidylprolyl isomerase [Acidimicrobiia bacterium]|nr:peptidylprolyl isomerase [Acidimicrobiia bacterium]